MAVCPSGVDLVRIPPTQSLLEANGCSLLEAFRAKEPFATPSLRVEKGEVRGTFHHFVRPGTASIALSEKGVQR